MKLSKLLYGIKFSAYPEFVDVIITGVQINSKLVKQGNVFMALNGTQVHGSQYILPAIEAGAIVIICEQLPDQTIPNIQYIQVKNLNQVAGIIAHNFYQLPSSKLKLVGVTGTNGKTTVATLLYQLFKSLGYTCGLISTIENKIENKTIESTHTTPDVIQLNYLLSKMVMAKCTHVFIEVSSHAIHQQRISGLIFEGGIFTNITHDHLDYHKNFDSYIETKKMFFDHLSKNAFSLSNADDKRGAIMLQNTKAKKYFYALKAPVQFKGKVIESSLNGLLMYVNDVEVHFRLIGEFNASNLMAVFGAAICLNQNKNEVLQQMSLLLPAKGRFEFLQSPQKKIISIIDYAHTPDALLNVLSTIKKIKNGNENIITVIGCGGNRDKAKRPLMAETACKISQKVIFTSDNPRNEKPEDIIHEMQFALLPSMKRKSVAITDRREAIKTALLMANHNDIVLVAGKGHEKYQEINGKKSFFDDKETVNELMIELAI